MQHSSGGAHAPSVPQGMPPSTGPGFVATAVAPLSGELPEDELHAATNARVTDIIEQQNVARFMAPRVRNLAAR